MDRRPEYAADDSLANRYRNYQLQACTTDKVMFFQVEYEFVVRILNQANRLITDNTLCVDQSFS
jgi:hypothetical protein